MVEFGLIGKNIDYSFSRQYFNEKFKRKNLTSTYVNFDIENITQFPIILQQNKNLKGMNVTIPYKETILPYLDVLSPEAKSIGAVNTIKVTKQGQLIGFNTDFYGFQKALQPFLHNLSKTALILGTGGASKAIEYALQQWDFKYKKVSRTPEQDEISYEDLDKETIQSHMVIINTTPLGTYPNVDTYPILPYQFLTKKHLLFDLTYNPEQTRFLKLGMQYHTKICNGLPMLIEQAEQAWKIWLEK